MVEEKIYRKKIYVTWLSMKTRCCNKNHIYYKNYGGRGIKISREWKDFDSFYKDMNTLMEEHISAFGKNNTQLDRIDNNKGYSKKNCRWVTRSEQQRNTRQNVFVSYLGKSILAKGFAEEKGLDMKKVYPLLRAGYNGEQIINKLS